MSTGDFSAADLTAMLYSTIGEVLRPLLVLYVERYGEAVTLPLEAV